MKDQQEIASRTDFIMKGPLRGRKAIMTIRKVRLLAPNVILVDTMDTDPAGATATETRLKLILEKRSGAWRILAAQNTRVSPPTF
jgi:uncharacterized protein (TIGR02246 family)